MARAFAKLTDTSFSITGAIYLTYNVTFLDTSIPFLETRDVYATIDALDTASTMKTKIADAIKAKGTELGLSITSNEITMPAFTKG